jgi:ectoine hydroxylase-related dioxygenase (phytanoyl-CoA dioxygenase family)
MGRSANPRHEEGSFSPRGVTAEEVEFFRNEGWAVLREFVDADAIADLRERAERFLQGPAETGRYGSRQFSSFSSITETDECCVALLRSEGIARASSALLEGDKPIRLQVSALLTKDPASQEGGHGPTVYHQDFPRIPLDRSWLVTFWIALVDVPAVMGTMRFLSQSHRQGVLGRSFVGDEESDIFESQPWLRRLRLSPPIDLAAGDATVHHALTVHGAPENRADTRRLSLAASYFDAGALYTGAEFAYTDNLGLKVDAPLDHPRFPEIRF